MKKDALIFLLVMVLAVASAAQQPAAPRKKPAAQTKAAPTQPPGTMEVKVGNQTVPVPPLRKFNPQKPVRIVLENGVVIFLQQDHELPLIDGIIRIRGGERNLPANKAGMMSIYAGSWRTGGTQAPREVPGGGPTVGPGGGPSEGKTGDQLDDFLEPRGAKVETGGGIESTSLTFSCLKGDFNDVFAVALDLLRHPAFRQDKIDLAKRQASGAISRRNDDLRSIAAREANQLGYGEQNPYARLSQYDTIASITRDDLLQFHQRSLAGRNMIIGVVGDFDRAQMEAALRQAFGSLPAGERIPRPELQFKQADPGIYFAEKEDVNQAAIRMVALTTLERKDPDFYAVSVMNEAFFSNQFSSRFGNDIRTKRGLAYAAGGSFSAPYDHPGLFQVAVDTKSANTIDAVGAMRDAIRDAATRPITPAELQRAKDSLLNSFIFRFDTKEKVLAEQLFLEFYGYPLDLLEQYPARVQAVMADDVNRVAKKYIHPEQLTVAIVGNSSEFGKPLASLGDVHKLDISIPQPSNAARASKPIASAGESAAAPDGKALLAKVVEALGDPQKIKALQSFEVRVSVKAPDGNAQARQLTLYPDKVRQEIETDRGTITIVQTPDAAFAVRGTNTQDLPNSMRQEMQADLKRDLVHIAKHANDPAQQVSAAPGEKLGDVQTEVLQVTSGNTSVSFDVDPSTGRVLRARYSMMGRNGPADVVEEFSDWRNVEGIMFPFTVRRLENGQESSTVTVNSIRLNPPADPKLFQRPTAPAPSSQQ